MAVTSADSKPNDRVYAGLGALLTALLLFLLLILVVFTTPNPPFPEMNGGGGGGGIELSFGDAAVGMGNTNPNELSGNPDPVKEIEPNILTSDVDEDAPTIPPKINKPSAPIKPIEKPKVNNSALFPNKGGSQGISNKPGNEGKPTGNPNALFGGGEGGKGPGSGGGEGGGIGKGKGPGEGDGEGPGKGNGKGGIGYSLVGRTPRSLPKPAYPSDAQGKVVIDIGVDEKGNVVSAKIGRGTTVTDKKLQDIAKAAAMRSKFSVKDDAPEQQFGNIVYTFYKGGGN